MADTENRVKTVQSQTHATQRTSSPRDLSPTQAAGRGAPGGGEGGYHGNAKRPQRPFSEKSISKFQLLETQTLRPDCSSLCSIPTPLARGRDPFGTVFEAGQCVTVTGALLRVGRVGTTGQWSHIDDLVNENPLGERQCFKK